MICPDMQPNLDTTFEDADPKSLAKPVKWSHRIRSTVNVCRSKEKNSRRDKDDTSTDTLTKFIRNSCPRPLKSTQPSTVDACRRVPESRTRVRCLVTSAALGLAVLALAGCQIVHPPADAELVERPRDTLAGEKPAEPESPQTPVGPVPVEAPPALAIVDNDQIPELSIADGRLTEGSGDGSMPFVVRLDPASAGTVTVQYDTADGSATDGADYTAASGTLTFAAGATAATINVAILDDTTARRWRRHVLLTAPEPRVAGC